MIYANRLRFRRPERDDIPLFIAWLNDPEVRQGISLYLPISKWEEEKWFENMTQRSLNERPFTIEIRTENEEWKAVGNCGLFNIDWRNRHAELGIMIGDRAYWNQGYGTEATKLMLRHAFQTLNLHRVFLRVFANNRRAKRAYEKAGFIHEGSMRQAEFVDGEYLDVHFMSSLQPEWDEKVNE